MMRRMVRTELWKALHNSNFYLALGIGMAIVLVHLIQNAMVVQELTELTLQGLEQGYVSGACDSISLFVMAIPYNVASYGAVLFQLVWPALAAIPYAWSYSMERRSGIYNQIVTRSSAGRYILAKYIAVFVSGGLVISLTVLTDLLLNALVCPSSTPDVCIRVSAVSNDTFLSELFYTNPWAHALIWCVVVFFLGGAAAGLVFFVGAKLKLRVLVMLVPFAVLMVWNVVYHNTINAYFWEYLPSLSLSPLELVRVIGGDGNPEWFVTLTIGLLTAAGLGAAAWQVKRHELV